MLSRCPDENVLDKELGRSENLLPDLPVLVPSFVFLREKPNDVLRLDSVLCRGIASLARCVGIDVGGYDFCGRFSYEFCETRESLGSCDE